MTRPVPLDALAVTVGVVLGLVLGVMQLLGVP